MAGSIWNGNEEHAHEFFEKNIWENGYEEKYIDLVNSVNDGDIVFLKSTFATANNNFLRIKGIGKVIRNPKTGTELVIDWLIKDIKKDIPGLSKYRSTFARVMPDDLWTIIKAIGADKLVLSLVYLKFRSLST